VPCPDIDQDFRTVACNFELRGRMRLVLAVVLVFGFFSLGRAQDDPSSKPAVAPAIGLQVGQQAPAFAARDQFGHDQSIETLKGAKGTVLLFFRSADW